MQQQQCVTLDSIGGGALAELFGAELSRVLTNIADPNTDPKTKRSISITVSFKANANRDVADVELTCTSKVAGIMTVQTQLFMGKHQGRLVAIENDPRQSGLFDAEKPALQAVAGTFGKKDGDQ